MQSPFILDAISPYDEMVSYEAIWARNGMTLSKITKLFETGRLPTELINPIEDLENIDKIKVHINNELGKFSIITSKDFLYPKALKFAKDKYEILYCKGDIGLLDIPNKISIVGTRKISEDGKQRTIQITKGLVANGYHIVSGLASGVDTFALLTAIKMESSVIGVIGTPINKYYPKENIGLQNLIAEKHLLVSHVPIYRYDNEPFNNHRFYFPQRNVVMASISDATVIIEASETSGTLVQARECIRLKKKLFILNSCFENKSITWPAKFEAQGAIRVKTIDDILRNMNV